LLYHHKNGKLTSFSDLLVAYAWALDNIKANNKTKAEKGEGICIVLTAYNNGSGWADLTPIGQLKKRLAIVMKGMANSRLAGCFRTKESEVDGVIEELFKVKRVLTNSEALYNHSKVVSVDQKLLYIGSDNAYPCYNEEHGIWVEHKPSIDAWYTGYWKYLWANSSAPSTADLTDKLGQPEV
jgi:hypothetical protein